MPSVRAIIARCGSRTEAVAYCASMAQSYPRLRAEYFEYMNTILNMGA